MSKLYENAFKSLEDIEDIVLVEDYKFNVKKNVKLNEGSDLEYVLISDGKNPRNSVIFYVNERQSLEKAKNDAIELAKNRVETKKEPTFVYHYFIKNNNLEHELLWSPEEEKKELDLETAIKVADGDVLDAQFGTDTAERKLAGVIKNSDKDLEEGAEGKKEQGKEFVIYDASVEGKAPILDIRKTRVEAEFLAHKLEKTGKYESVSYDEVPEGKFKKGDDFWGPFDDNWEKIESIHEEEKDSKIIKRVGKVRRSRDLQEQKSLKEERFDINDEDEIKKAKKLTKKHVNNVEQIVDVDASTVDELKASYVGNVILQCPVCRTLIYKKPDAIVKDEEQDEVVLYNKDEKCPHCGSVDGFELVGQVATMDVEIEEKEPTTGKEEILDNSEVAVEKENLPELKIEGEDNIKFEELDETKFDNLLNEFLSKKFSNVESYKTIDGEINTMNEIMLEGVISYKSGKHENIKFNFNIDDTLNENMTDSVIFRLTSEKFSKLGTFILESKINAKELKPEHLSLK